MPEIVYRSLTEIVPYDKNPRFIKGYDFDRLCQSMQNDIAETGGKYFESRPIILSNRTGKLVVIAGNMRYRAAEAIGMTKVPTVLIEGLTGEYEKEIIIRDNVNNGSWDFDALANEWSRDDLVDWGIPLWDSEPEPEDNEVKKPKAELRIVFTDFEQLEKATTEIEELLRSYDGAEIK